MEILNFSIGWMDGFLYFMCNMGSHKIFGPRTPQSLNCALLVLDISDFKQMKGM